MGVRVVFGKVPESEALWDLFELKKEVNNYSFLKLRPTILFDLIWDNRQFASWRSDHVIHHMILAKRPVDGVAQSLR